MPINSAKLADLAQAIDGQVIDDQKRVEVCIKGFVAGFPITLEATKVNYPFGVNYFLETGNFTNEPLTYESFKLTVMPKYMQGWLSFISRILFFESRGQKINLPELDRALRFRCDNIAAAKKFVYCSGVATTIIDLERISHFNEMLINSKAGIYLSQPAAFQSLDTAECLEIFSLMARLGQVLFEGF